MDTLKNQLIRLGHLKPELREHIRPLLREANKTARLSASEKADINKDFHSKGLDGNGRFRTVGEALSLIWDILWFDYDIALVNGMFRTFVYSQDKGHETENIGRLQDEYGDRIAEFANATLVIQWHHFESSGLYEVIAYIG